jgi:hypothetical protein
MWLSGQQAGSQVRRPRQQDGTDKAGAPGQLWLWFWMDQYFIPPELDFSPPGSFIYCWVA